MLSFPTNTKRVEEALTHMMKLVMKRKALAKASRHEHILTSPCYAVVSSWARPSVAMLVMDTIARSLFSFLLFLPQT